MAKTTAIEAIMRETIDYGGIAATRWQAFQHAKAAALSRGADEKSAERCADRVALMPPQVPHGLAERLIPWAEAQKRGFV